MHGIDWLFGRLSAGALEDGVDICRNRITPLGGRSEGVSAMASGEEKRMPEREHAPGVVIHVTDQGATSPDPVPCDLDLEPSSALGGGSSTRSSTAPHRGPAEEGA